MIELRPYQEKAVTHAVDNLFERGNSLIVAGTGAGKTIMLSEAIKRFSVAYKAKEDRFPHTLVLVHRNEIHNQNITKFSQVAPSIPTSEITAGRKSVNGLVHFGMVQTVSNIIRDLPVFDLIVIDEAHHSMASTYLDIINQNKQKAEANKLSTYLLGVSATPNRGDKLPLIDLFDNFYQITTKYLIDSHYLVRPTFVDLAPRFGGEIGYLNKNVDWDSPEAIELIAKLISEYLNKKQEGKSIIFAPNHKVCKMIETSLKMLGRTPAYLDKGLPEDIRACELERFERGSAEELINVDIATEGYDFPDLRNVVDFDTNGNETQWVQKVGRGLRLAPGKTGCTVIDFGGNLALYPDVEVDVRLEGEFKAKCGERLILDNLFTPTPNPTQKTLKTAEFEGVREVAPYAPPEGWETMNDEEFGIVFVLCGDKGDALVVKNSEEYTLFITNKVGLQKMRTGSFEECIIAGGKLIKTESEPIWKENKPISRMQIKKLTPKYPTMTLDFYGANCLICWETWKKAVKDLCELKQKD